MAYTDALQLALLTLTLICVLAAILAHFDLTEVFRRVASRSQGRHPLGSGT